MTRYVRKKMIGPKGSLRSERAGNTGNDRQDRKPEDRITDTGDRTKQRQLQTVDRFTVGTALFQRDHQAHQETDEVWMGIDECHVVGQRSRQLFLVVSVDLL